MRCAFQACRAAYEAAGRTLVWIDESGFARDMPRRFGYAPVGQRCHGRWDWHAKGRTKVIGALWGSQLIAVGLFESSVNAEVFLAWTHRVLLPQLPPFANNPIAPLTNSFAPIKYDHFYLILRYQARLGGERIEWFGIR